MAHRPQCRQRKDDALTGLSGYLHPAYANSLLEWGTPLPLQRAGGTVLRRVVPGTDNSDAMGCYPLLACRDWSSLAADLAEIGDSIVAFSAVVDPLATVAEESLRAAFPDVLRPFKDHFVIELQRPGPPGSAEHRRKARRAHARVNLHFVEQPACLLEEWTKLYALLVKRHAISGLRVFSAASFERQLIVPGVRAIRAEAGGEAVGITLWTEHDGNAYYHLGAQNETGYACAVSYAMVDAAITWFRELGCRFLDLGAGAGLDQGASGLARFKRGWATTIRTAWFGGRILDADTYARVSIASGQTAANYFPAYRCGEFG